jgi:hypothetical protein
LARRGASLPMPTSHQQARYKLEHAVQACTSGSDTVLLATRQPPHRDTGCSCRALPDPACGQPLPLRGVGDVGDPSQPEHSTEYSKEPKCASQVSQPHKLACATCDTHRLLTVVTLGPHHPDAGPAGKAKGENLSETGGPRSALLLRRMGRQQARAAPEVQQYQRAHHSSASRRPEVRLARRGSAALKTASSNQSSTCFRARVMPV